MYADKRNSGINTRYEIMISVTDFYNVLKSGGVDFFTGVPDSLLKNLCAYISDNTSDSRHIIAANEGNAVGLAAGHWLATGKLPLVYMQNSGIGNALNPLISLADEDVYSIPMLLVIGWRGEPGVHDEPQHLKQGKITEGLLDCSGIPYIVLSTDWSEASAQLKEMLDSCKRLSKPHAVVIHKGTFDAYSSKSVVRNDFSVSREEFLKYLLECIAPDDIVISTTGKLSRELYELRDLRKEGHYRDFLTVGSMGHTSSIALGVALEHPQRTVWCLDGDGSAIMHLGAIATMGSRFPGNIRHVIFNNGAHESVGAQPTVGLSIDFPAIASACGYKKVFSINNKENLVSVLKDIKGSDGPILIELQAAINSRKDLGRPASSPQDNKKAFMQNLLNNGY